ncbi:MAG: ABC transporter permease [Saprospiraceae bacterium]|nr:ABC transporter permease [Saprospiraceae bacterium]
MDKLWIIIKREYLTRVKRKAFILATFLTPLFFGIFFVVITIIFAYQSDDVRKIVIQDPGEVMGNAMADSKSLYFTFSDETLEELKVRYNKEEFDGILVIPPVKDLQSKKMKVQYLSDKQLDPESNSALESELEKKLRKYKIRALGFDQEKLASLDVSITIDPDQINKKDGAEDEKTFTSLTTAVAAAMGGLMGVIMYLMVFINGSMVMRSVMEEKMSRIVEVMISSVKPFQLMLGKIIGVGAVGLTQFLIWAILIPLIALIVSLFMGIDSSPQMMPPGATGAEELMDSGLNPGLLIAEIQRMNWWLILPMFIVFFLGGFFIYSSLFAAVGSAIGDDMGEGQALTIPITIPVILAFYIMIVAIRAPNSSLAVWASIFPLFSPIVMPARLAFNPPAWQIILSAGLLILSVFFFVWLSGRIYRIGILMYGKKASFKEIGKWLFSKG